MTKFIFNSLRNKKRANLVTNVINKIISYKNVNNNLKKLNHFMIYQYFYFLKKKIF
jgi:hypothetical protein